MHQINVGANNSRAVNRYYKHRAVNLLTFRRRLLGNRLVGRPDGGHGIHGRQWVAARVHFVVGYFAVSAARTAVTVQVSVSRFSEDFD